MKKTVSIVLGLCFVVSLLTFGLLGITASAETDDLFSFELTDTEAVIIGCDSQIEGAVVIPSTYRDLPVTGIGSNVFNHNQKITSVTLPDTLTSIGDYAFWGCSALESVTFGNSLVYLGNHAFSDCTSLKRASLPQGVESIGDCAFQCCTQLESVQLPRSVTTIGRYAFYECVALPSITLPDKLTSIGGWAFGKCESLANVTLPSGLRSIGENAFYYCRKFTSIEVPSSVEFIDAGAFMWCDKLLTAVLPDGITAISPQLFAGCRALESVNIPSTVVSIGEGAFNTCVSLTMLQIPGTVNTIDRVAFSNCESLMSMQLPAGITTLSEAVFSGCRSLKSIVIPSHVKTVEAGAFRWCEALESITIENGVTSIGEGAFQGCTALTELFIPQSVSSIGNAAFSDCDTLASITADPNNAIYHSAGNGLIETASKTLILGCKNTVIPTDGSVTAIGESAFLYCDSLPDLIIPEGITSIGSYAFANCRSYASITLPLSVTSIGEYAFNGFFGTLRIHKNHTYAIEYAESENVRYVLGKYTVTFQNYDGSIIASGEYYVGDYVPLPQITPTRPADKTFSYSFDTWDSPVGLCDGDKVYTAVYHSNYIDYFITFKDHNGNVLQHSTFHYGDPVAFLGEYPQKPADEVYTYAFAGWDSDVTPCDGHKVYTAVFAKTNVVYTVTFKDYDGTVLQSKTYYYGTPVTPPQVTLTRPADETFTYTFGGWNTPVENCTGDAEYTAHYIGTWIDYTVTFQNYDGSILQSGTYHYGETVVPPAEIPTKPADGSYVFLFIGWDSEVIPCNGNKVYTALFGTADATFTVTFKNYNGTVLQSATYRFGEAVTPPSKNPTRASDKKATYTFAGWDSEVVPCNGDKVYTAVFTTNYYEYTVTFKNRDGSVLESQIYHFGDTIVPPDKTPTYADNIYTYTFTGWSDQLGTCTGNKTFTAQYTKQYTEYTVTFQNYDGSILQSGTYHYGDPVTPPAELPQKPADDTYIYAFIGWNSDVVSCDGNKVYTAVFQEKTEYVPQGSAALHGDTAVQVGNTFTLILKVNDSAPADFLEVALTFGEGLTIVNTKWLVNGKNGIPYDAATKKGSIHLENTDINCALYEITVKALDASDPMLYFGVEITARMGGKVVLNTVAARDVIITCDSHKYGEWDYFDEHSHGRSCSVCGIFESAPHSFKNYVHDNNATCTQDATKSAKCTDCGGMSVEPLYGTALGHTGGKATCSTPAVCTRCGESYGETNGNKHGDTVLKNEKTPNCTKEGYTGDTYCVDCGQRIKTGEVLPKAHPYQATVIPATYTKKGYTEHTCPLCGDSYQDTFTKAKGLPKLSISSMTDGISGKTTLHWTAIDEADGYEIYYATSKSGKYSLYTKTEADFAALNVAVDKTYYFKVKAVCASDSTLNGALSDDCKVVGKCAQTVAEIANSADGYPLIKWSKVSGAKKYEIWYATSENGTYKKLSSTSSLSYTYKKAKMDTYYYFKVRAYGKSTASMGAFSDVLCGLRRLAKPSISANANFDASSASITWKKISGAKGYELQVSVNGKAFETLTTLTATSYTHKDLTVGNTYTYRLRTLGNNAAAASDYSVEKAITVKCGRPVLTLGHTADGKILISWKPVKGAASYEIQVSTTAKSKYKTLATVEEAVSFLHEASVSGSTYYYKMRAVDANGVAGDYCAYKSAVGKFPAPVITEVTTDAAGYPLIKWSKVSGAKKYEIWYATSENGTYKKLSTSSAASYTYKKAKMDTYYYFKVRAYGKSTSSAGEFSEVVSALRKLGRPSVTVSADFDNASVKISWKKVSGAKGYKLQVSVNGKAFETLTTLTATSYTHKDLTVGSTYIYRVSTLGSNEAAESDYSTEKAVTVKCGRPKLSFTYTADGKIILNWSSVKGAALYEIQVSTTAKSKYKTLATVEEAVSFLHEASVSGSTYYYKMRAIDASGVAGDFCAYKSAVGKFPAPTITEITTDTSGYPVIKWSKVSGAKNYEIWYSTSENGTYKKLASTSSLSYTYKKAKMNVDYYIKVRAYGKSTSSAGEFSETRIAWRKLAKPSISVSVNQSGRKITVKWKKISGAYAYEVQMRVNDTEYMTVGIVNSLSFVHENLDPGCIYVYRVRALSSDTKAWGDYGAAKSAVLKVDKPKVSIALNQNGKPRLTWEVVDGAVSYNIYAATSKSGKYKILGNVEAFSLDYQVAKAGKTTYFKVCAVDANGYAGANSSVVYIKSK